MGHILVVEDEDDARESLKELLQLEGFDVLAAENGLEAIKLLETGKKPCLVFLDLMMPVMNGFEFLQQARHKPRDLLGSTPVVLVSAAADALSVQRSGCPVVKKPADIEQLLTMARTYCPEHC